MRSSNSIALLSICLQCEARLEIVPGATQLFEEPGALETVVGLATHWLTSHLGNERL